MESFKDKVRYKILLDTCQITWVEYGELGCKFNAISPKGMIVKADLSFRPDAKIGDLIPIYTELLAHDQPGPPSIQ